MSPKDVMEKSKWIKRPDFLNEPVESWLKEETYEDYMESDSPEVKIVKVNTSAVKENNYIVKRRQRFSSRLKAKMAVAFCLRYKRRLRDRVLAKRKLSSNGTSEEGLAGPTNGTSASTVVNATDLEEAEAEITKHVQRNEFPSEMKSLQDIQAKAMYGSRESDKEKKVLFNNTSSLRTLDPVLDSDGVMRVGGRIRKAKLPCTLKNPVILPKSSHITSLIISHVHERTHLRGRGITLNGLRSSEYWLVSGNAMVRQFVSIKMCNMLSPSWEPKRTEDGRSAKVAHRASTTLYLLRGRLLQSLACPTKKSGREEIRGLVYLLSEQSSTNRTGGFLGNVFIY